MAKPKSQEPEGKGGSWIFRGIPRELMKRVKIAAAIEGKPIRTLVIETLQAKVEDLERKGMLPKGK